jgi:hypothetical protein
VRGKAVVGGSGVEASNGGAEETVRTGAARKFSLGSKGGNSVRFSSERLRACASVVRREVERPLAFARGNSSSLSDAEALREGGEVSPELTELTVDGVVRVRLSERCRDCASGTGVKKLPVLDSSETERRICSRKSADDAPTVCGGWKRGDLRGGMAPNYRTSDCESGKDEVQQQFPAVVTTCIADPSSSAENCLLVPVDSKGE